MPTTIDHLTTQQLPTQRSAQGPFRLTLCAGPYHIHSHIHNTYLRTYHFMCAHTHAHWLTPLSFQTTAFPPFSYPGLALRQWGLWEGGHYSAVPSCLSSYTQSPAAIAEREAASWTATTRGRAPIGGEGSAGRAEAIRNVRNWGSTCGTRGLTPEACWVSRAPHPPDPVIPSLLVQPMLRERSDAISGPGSDALTTLGVLPQPMSTPVSVPRMLP